jgi:hypothetical protein
MVHLRHQLNPRGIVMLRLKTPEDVIRHLRNDVYVRIGRSALQGVGVFAIRPIPKGIDPFGERELDMEFIKIPDWRIQDDERIAPGVKRLVRDLSSKKDGRRNIPMSGYNSVTPGFLMNHSEKPNVGIDRENFWITLRPIKEGEELTIYYDSFNDPGESDFGNMT